MISDSINNSPRSSGTASTMGSSRSTTTTKRKKKKKKKKNKKKKIRWKRRRSKSTPAVPPSAEVLNARIKDLSKRRTEELRSITAKVREEIAKHEDHTRVSPRPSKQAPSLERKEVDRHPHHGSPPPVRTPFPLSKLDIAAAVRVSRAGMTTEPLPLSPRFAAPPTSPRPSLTSPRKWEERRQRLLASAVAQQATEKREELKQRKRGEDDSQLSSPRGRREEHSTGEEESSDATSTSTTTTTTITTTTATASSSGSTNTSEADNTEEEEDNGDDEDARQAENRREETKLQRGEQRKRLVGLMEQREAAKLKKSPRARLKRMKRSISFSGSRGRGMDRPSPATAPASVASPIADDVPVRTVGSKVFLRVFLPNNSFASISMEDGIQTVGDLLVVLRKKVVYMGDTTEWCLFEYTNKRRRRQFRDSHSIRSVIEGRNGDRVRKLVFEPAGPDGDAASSSSPPLGPSKKPEKGVS